VPSVGPQGGLEHCPLAVGRHSACCEMLLILAPVPLIIQESSSSKYCKANSLQVPCSMGSLWRTEVCCEDFTLLTGPTSAVRWPQPLNVLLLAAQCIIKAKSSTSPEPAAEDCMIIIHGHSQQCITPLLPVLLPAPSSSHPRPLQFGHQRHECSKEAMQPAQAATYPHLHHSRPHTTNP